MSCKHEKIKSVNCEIFCMECGEKLPIDYLVAKRRIVEQKSAEKPVADVPADDNPVVAETPAETPENGENGEQPKEDAQPATRGRKKQNGGRK